MAGYRFSQMAQALRSSPLQVLKKTPTISSTGAPTYSYKPILSVENMAQVTSSVSALSSGHGHLPEVYRGTAKGWEGIEKCKTWKDIPDEWVPKTSKIDPENPIYADAKYIKIRKKQIWAQRPGAQDIPVYLMFGQIDKIQVIAFTIALACMILWSLSMHYQNIYKKYYPDSNLFILF